jgi:hypothetical protein
LGVTNHIVEGLEVTDDRRNSALSWVFALLSAAAGFVVTPYAVYFLGVFLFAGRPGYGEQGLGFGLFCFGVLAALPGAVCWGVLALRPWEDPRRERAGRRLRSVASAWAIAVVVYGAFTLAIILAAWLIFPGRPLPWGPRR